MDRVLNKYPVIDLYRGLDGSINLRETYIIQIILNMILGIDKLSTKPTPQVKTPLAKN